MPDPLALRLLIDTEQPRVKTSRIGLVVSGAEWDGPHFSETYLIPRTNTLICRPTPLRPDWHTSSTGVNARWSLADFGLSESAGWKPHGTKDGVGAVRMVNKKGMTTPAVLSAALVANRAVFVSFFCFNVGNDDAAVYFECGYSNTGTGDHGPSWRFWSGGKVDVYKDGAFLTSYSLGNRTGTQTANQYQDLIVLPMRGREITVISITGGDSFTHVYEDIPEGVTNPQVTPPEKFWWYVPSANPAKPATVDVEAAPILFHDGFATSLDVAFGRPPKPDAETEVWENEAAFSGISNARIYGDAFTEGGHVTSVSIVERDGETPFIPNGSSTECLMRIDMTGGTHTPFIDGVSMGYKDEIVWTTAPEEGPTDVTFLIREADLEKANSADPTTLTVKLGYPTALADVVPQLFALGNRPAQAWVNGKLLIDGVTSTVAFDDGEHDGVMTATLKVFDRMKSLQDAFMRDRMPMDGMPLSKPAGSGDVYNSAVEFWYRRIGIPENYLDLDDANYTLPRIPSRDSKDFCHQSEVGAHPFDELRELQEDKATTWLWGAIPRANGIRYVFRDPDLFSSTPDITLYRSDEDAEAAGADADEDVYWRYHDEPLEIEANEVRAGGIDPRTGRPHFSYGEDLMSKDPALSPSTRPENWVGEERPMGILSKRFARKEDCDRVVEFVLPQVSARFWVGEWTSSMLFRADGAPIWRGDLVRLDGRRDFRVTSLRVKFWREPDDEANDAVTFREATYTGGTLSNAGGIGLQAVKDAHARKAVAKTIRREGADLIENATTRMVALAVG